MKTKTKRAVCVFLSVVLLLCSAPLGGISQLDFSSIKAAAADELAATGSCGENVNWIFDSSTGLLTISGTGAMTDYAASASPFSTNTQIKKIVVESGVTTVGKNAFIDCNSLAEVSLPDSITDICDNAFYHCDNLPSVNFGSGLKSIGEYAFFGCYNLTSITFAGGLDSIGSWAFYECRRLTNPIFPDGMTSIGVGAFENCLGLTNVTVPDSVTSVKNSAFEGCTGLTRVSFGKSISEIGHAFTQCSKLTTIEIDPENPYYCVDENSVVFNKEKTVLIIYPSGVKTTAYSIPAGIKQIYDYAFEKNEYLTDVTISNGVNVIGKFAFQRCKNLKTVTIPNSVTSIGDGAFMVCHNLESISIPAGVTRIANNVFNNCSSLQDVYYSGSQEQWNQITIIAGNDSLKNATIHFNSFGASDNLLWTRVDDTVTITGFDNAASGKIVIPSAINGYPVTAIGERAFENSADITDVTVPASVRSIGAAAFSGCAKLANVAIHGELSFQSDTFAGTRASVILMNDAPQTKKLAQGFGINCIDVVYDSEKKILSFNGVTTVYPGVKYDYIREGMTAYPDSEYLYFDKLIFDGVKNEKLRLDEFEFVDLSREDLSFNHLYVNIKMVNGGESRTVTFEQMLETLENGNYDAFRLQVKSDEGEEEKTIFEKIAESVQQIFTDALNAISRAINFFARLFKKR